MSSKFRPRRSHALSKLLGLLPKQDGSQLPNAGIPSEHENLNAYKLLAAEELLEREAHFRMLTDYGQALIWTSGTDMKCNYFNQPWLNFTGRKLEQEIGDGWVDGVHPDDLDTCIKTYVEAFGRQEKFSMEYRVLHNSGEYRWIQDDGNPRYNSKGEFLGYIGHCLDITQRKEGEEKLRVSEANYRGLFENSVMGISRASADGRLLMANNAYAKMYGYASPEEMMAQVPNVSQLYFNSEERNELIQSLNKSGYIEPREFRVVHRDGTRFYVLVGARIIRNANGEIECYQAEHVDITSIKLAEEGLRKSEEKYRNIFENVQDAYYETALDGTILEVSPSIELVSNGQYKRESLLGKSMYDFYFTPEGRNVFITALMQTGSILDYELVLVDTEGSPVTCSISSKICFEGDTPVKVVGSIRNIQERKRIENELVASKEKAEEANSLKSAFLSNMSHEIRTPMNSIMGFSELMLHVDGDEKNRFASIVLKNSKQLLSLIDDVILLSKLQTEKFPVTICDVNPAKLVEEVYQRLIPVAEANKLELSVKIPEVGNNLVIHSDPEKIDKIINNLVTNAIMYTRQGNAEFGFDVREGEVIFYVKDTGIGIPQEELDKIFDSFYRGQHAVNSAIRGTGMGLNIARMLAELLGGELGVTSAPGEGSRFYFTIPFETSNAEQPDKPISAVQLIDLKNFVILIAEDEPDNYLFLEILLRDKVKRIDHAKNGMEAIEMASKNKYSLIFMDLKMPIMGGIDAVKVLKKKFPSIPIIAQTAYATTSETEEALAAGCEDYLIKPIKRSELFAVLNKFGN